MHLMYAHALITSTRAICLSFVRLYRRIYVTSFCTSVAHAVMHTLVGRPGMQGLQVRAAFVHILIFSCTRRACWLARPLLTSRYSCSFLLCGLSRIVANYSLLHRLLALIHVHRQTECVGMVTPANLPTTLPPYLASHLLYLHNFLHPPTTASPPRETFISKPRPAGFKTRQPKFVSVSGLRSSEIPAVRKLRISVLSQSQLATSRWGFSSGRGMVSGIRFPSLRQANWRISIPRYGF